MSFRTAMSTVRVRFGCLLFRTAACLSGPQCLQLECVLGACFSGPLHVRPACSPDLNDPHIGIYSIYLSIYIYIYIDIDRRDILLYIEIHIHIDIFI